MKKAKSEKEKDCSVVLPKWLIKEIKEKYNGDLSMGLTILATASIKNKK